MFVKEPMEQLVLKWLSCIMVKKKEVFNLLIHNRSIIDSNNNMMYLCSLDETNVAGSTGEV